MPLYISKKELKKIKSPLDNLNLNKNSNKINDNKKAP